MGLSSSKKTTTSDPWKPAQPYILKGMEQTNQTFDANQPMLQQMSGIAQDAFNQLAPGAFGANPFLQGAQSATADVYGGKFVGANPGASTYSRVMNAGANDPSMSGLTALASGTRSPGDYSGIGTANPAMGTLAGMAAGSSTNPAASLYAGMAHGGSNSARPGIASYAYGTGSLGAGDRTIGRIAATGGGMGAGAGTLSNFAAGNGVGSNEGAGYDSAVLGGRYLTANPYIDQMAQRSGDAATKAANQRFGAAGLGAGLSTAYTDVVSKNVADAENALRYQNYNTERGYQDAASARASSNYNATQDRSLQGATGLQAASQNQTANRLGAANALSSGSRADATSRLGALNDLSGIDQQNFGNRMAAAGGLGSTYAADADRQLSAGQSLGSLYNSTGQLQLSAQQAMDQAYQGDRAAQLSALGALGSRYDAGNASALDAARAADGGYTDQINQMLQAASLAPNMRAADYAGVTPALSLLNTAADTPYVGTAALNGQIRQASNGYGTSTTTSTPGLFDWASLAANNAYRYTGG